MKKILLACALMLTPLPAFAHHHEGGFGYGPMGGGYYGPPRHHGSFGRALGIGLGIGLAGGLIGGSTYMMPPPMIYMPPPPVPYYGGGYYAPPTYYTPNPYPYGNCSVVIINGMAIRQNCW